MDVCAAIERNDYPDRQASTIVIVDFWDIGRQVTGPWFSPYILNVLSNFNSQIPFENHPMPENRVAERVGLIVTGTHKFPYFGHKISM
ncbi:hypothetical protein TNCV_4417281 [Trichonephila clavipes]|nr:hypothetical protein TNCV_4417281 [Trichonephila clavipes]